MVAMDGSRARALLGVRPHATTEEVRRAFRRAALAAHPDRGGDPSAFRALVVARDVLLRASPARRSLRWDVTAPEAPSIDLVDVARRRPRPSPESVPDFDADFDAVLAAALAAA
jgi:hypothetical protein